MASVGTAELRITKLHPDEPFHFQHEDPDLSDFFNNHAGLFQESLLATTFCVRYGVELAAMFSLSNDNIQFPKAVAEELFPKGKIFHSYPAVKIARLGVADGHRGNKFGAKIVFFLKIFFVVKNKTGCRFITVDAYNKPKVIKFYQDNGFTLLPIKNPDRRHTLPLYFDLKPIRKWLVADETEMASALQSVSDISL